MRVFLLGLGVFGISAWHSHTVATPVTPTSDVLVDYGAAVGDHPSSWALARALDARLIVRQRRDGKPIHVQHCRASEGGCRARIAAMSRQITESSNAHDVDPFLTAAVALRESGLNPLAVSPVGATGVIQLHPRYRGKTVPFVYNQRYRGECARQPAACQREVLDAGLGLLQWAVRRCGGSVPKGLGWYNSGDCKTNQYARSVLSERRRLLRLTKATDPENKALFLN